MTGREGDARPEGPSAPRRSLDTESRESFDRTERRPRRAHVDALPEHPRYEHRDVLGRGGQGIVYRVFDRELSRDVALKTLREHRLTAEHVDAFVDEARSAAGLEHPNIVPIYDVGLLGDGRPFYTMRLVSGRSLSQALDGLRDAEIAGCPPARAAREFRGQLRLRSRSAGRLTWARSIEAMTSQRVST